MDTPKTNHGDQWKFLMKRNMGIKISKDLSFFDNGFYRDDNIALYWSFIFLETQKEWQHMEKRSQIMDKCIKKLIIWIFNCYIISYQFEY